MSSHFRGGGGATSLANAIKIHGREIFMSVILLAGIEQQEELHWTEIAVIQHVGCLAPGGYNLRAGGSGFDKKRHVIGIGNCCFLGRMRRGKKSVTH